MHSTRNTDTILRRIEELTVNIEKIYVSLDHLAIYLRAKTNTTILGSKIEDKKIVFDLQGKTDTELMLSIFENEEEDISRRYVNIETFDGAVTIED